MDSEFVMEQQEQLGWCWAAVGVSVNEYFESPTAVTQCELVNEVLHVNDSCQKHPPTASEGESLRHVLDFINALSSTAAPTPLQFSDLQAQIKDSKPVCARIQWFGGEGHFIVLFGWGITASGQQWVDIADPFYGYSTIPYDQLLTRYHNSGAWTDTYFLKDPNIIPTMQGVTNGTK